MVGNLKSCAPRNAHWHSQELRIWLERLNNLLLNTVKPKFGAIFVFLGTASSFIEIISSLETEAKQ